jgi:site-specific DNA-cytosine methylase
MKRMLELFAGTKSVGKVFEADGYDVISLDYNPKFNTTHVADILTWDYRVYPPFYFDVIWASPDCTTWSIATGGRYRTKQNIYGLNNQYQPRATDANKMILRVIEILNYFQPNCWFIENPRGLLIHFPPLKEFIEEMGANVNLVYYGNYNNWGFPKPTHIWSNLPLWDDEIIPEMDTKTYVIKLKDGKPKRYYKAFRFKSAEERSKIPSELIERLKGLI